MLSVRRISLAVLLIVLLATFTIFGSLAGSKVAQAKVHPNIFCDFSQCNANVTWPGNVHGAFAIVTINEASCTSVSQSFSVDISLDTANHTGFAFAGYGCNVYDASSTWIFFAAGTSGNVIEEPIPAKDIGKTVEIGVSYYTSKGGGEFLWIHGGSSNETFCSPCSIPGGYGTYSSIALETQVVGTWTGTYWSRIDYTKSRYLGLNGVISYQTNGGSNFATNPPQMYWGTPPRNGNNGGDLISCARDTGATC